MSMLSFAVLGLLSVAVAACLLFVCWVGRACLCICVFVCLCGCVVV